jgi:hypothetical protein
LASYIHALVHLAAASSASHIPPCRPPPCLLPIKHKALYATPLADPCAQALRQLME